MTAVDMRNLADHASGQGAAALARRLRDFWRAKGGTVLARVERAHAATDPAKPVPLDLAASIYAVRTDMVNGWPRGYDPK